MNLLDQRAFGIVILVLLGTLVTVKRISTGSIFDRPQGNFLVQFVNIFNLLSLLVVNPLATIFLITRRMATIDPTHVIIGKMWTLSVIEIIGLVVYAGGYALMAWALITLGHNYQLGGSSPRAEDQLIVSGPYRLVRHPMYTAALCISFGLACLVQSWVCFGLFCIYLVLIILLIPAEEAELRKAYSEQYRAYQQKTKELVPFVY